MNEPYGNNNDVIAQAVHGRPFETEIRTTAGKAGFPRGGMSDRLVSGVSRSLRSFDLLVGPRPP